jgi:hypothetical protein
MMKTTALLAFCTLALTALKTHAYEFEGAVLYEDANYRGSSLVLYPGEGIPYLSDYWLGWGTWNDNISSVAVWGPVTVYLYEHSNYGGEVTVLNDHTAGFHWWNDRVSSVWVDYSSYDGWFEDFSLQSWVYWDGDWAYHEEGLGWIYGGYYESDVGGWLYDSALGWIYTSAEIYPWFFTDYGEAYYFLHGNTSDRWFYNEKTGWKIY